jgi:hypothetical protein
MINQVVLVGVVSDISIDEKSITLEVFDKKNNKNNYPTCIFSKELVDTIQEYFYLDQVIGVKGHLETVDNKTIVKIDKLSMLN